MDTLIAALDRGSSLRDEAALRRWLLKIATNLALGPPASLPTRDMAPGHARFAGSGHRRGRTCRIDPGPCLAADPIAGSRGPALLRRSAGGGSCRGDGYEPEHRQVPAADGAGAITRVPRHLGRICNPRGVHQWLIRRPTRGSSRCCAKSSTAEVANLPLTLGPNQVLERAAAVRSRSRLRPFDIGQPTARVRRLSMSLGAVAVLAVAIVALRLSTAPDRVDPVAALPTTPDAWSRVVIDAGSDAQVVSSVAVSPRGLLAVVSADDGPAQLFASTDGDDWTLVPADQHPPLRACGPDCYFGVDGAGRTRRDHRRHRSRVPDRRQRDLALGRRLRLAAPCRRRRGSGSSPLGGCSPRLPVALDSSPSEATTRPGSRPMAPTGHWPRCRRRRCRSSTRQGSYSEPTVEMRGLTVAGDTLFAWGSTTASVLGSEDLDRRPGGAHPVGLQRRPFMDPRARS